MSQPSELYRKESLVHYVREKKLHLKWKNNSIQDKAYVTKHNEGFRQSVLACQIRARIEYGRT